VEAIALINEPRLSAALASRLSFSSNRRVISVVNLRSFSAVLFNGGLLTEFYPTFSRLAYH
jgi:hypothetical protein